MKTEEEILAWRKEHRKRLRKRIGECKIHIKEMKEKKPKHQMKYPELFDSISECREFMAYCNKKLKEPLNKKNV